MAAETDVMTEFSSANPPLQRHLSLSEDAIAAHTHPSRARGPRRGWTLAECEFDELCRNCPSFFSCWTSPTQQQKAGRSIADIIDEEEDDEGLLPYKTPSRFKVLCRKLRSEAKSMYRQNPSMMLGTSRFHYDALSYAMNFDDGEWTQMQDYQGNSVQMRLHSARFSGSIPVPSPTNSSEP